MIAPEARTDKWPYDPVVVPFVLDTDIGTDVDDALALALAVRHPEIDLRAITTVSGDTRKRAAIAATLLRLAGRDDVEVAAGVGGHEDQAWLGHEGDGIELDDAERISRRDAGTLLVERSREERLTIATVGMQSNVAAALDHDADLSERISLLAVMGGAFAPIRVGDVTLAPTRDHNLVTDPRAAVRVLNAGLPTLYCPLDVTIHTALRREHLDRLRGGDELCRALVALIDVWAPLLHRRGVPEDVVSLLHDPLTVACLVERSFVTTATMPVTVVVHEDAVRTFVDPVRGNTAEVVTSVEADAFAEWWLDVVLTA
jgi:purine nucleosidase